MDESKKRAEHRHFRRDQMFGERQFRQFIRYPGIDIGPGDYEPAFGFTGVGLDYDGYDGVTLPFNGQLFKTVHSSHVLEHVDDPVMYLREWFRVLAIGGHMIIVVPHQHLYEKKDQLPSQFNKDHKSFFSIWGLSVAIEGALKPNTYRIVYIRDNDWGYDYKIPVRAHAEGCYEIEAVIKKIEPPTWDLIE